MIDRRQLEDALFDGAASFIEDSTVLGGRGAMEAQCLEAGVEFEDLQAVAEQAVVLNGPALPRRAFVMAGFLWAARALRERSEA